MAAGLPTPVPMHCIQHNRFTKRGGWLLWDLSLSLSGNIAVTGCNKKTHRTSIDVYSTVRNSGSRDKPKILYSKEFKKYVSEDGWKYWGRYVSFVDSFHDNRGLVVATGLGDKLEVFDLKQDRVLKSRKVTLVNQGWIICLSVREREIFIGFWESNKITVYDVIDLKEIKSIILQQGIQNDYWPGDITAIGDRMCVCVGHDSEESNFKSLIFDKKSGSILSELTKPTDAHWYAFGITVYVPLGVAAVVWSQTYKGKRKGSDVIVFYPLFSQNNSSFLIVEVEFGVGRIRISDRGDRMVTGNRVTREVKVYDMADIFTYNQLKTNLTSQLRNDDCVRLADFFALPKDQSDTALKSDTSTESFLLALEETGLLQPANVDRLTEAFTELKISSSCSSLIDFYQNTRTSAFYKETIQKLKEENQWMKTKLQAADIKAEQNITQVQKLQKHLEGTEKDLQKTEEIHQKAVLEHDQYQLQFSSLKDNHESSKEELLKTKELLEKSVQEKNAIKAELEQYKSQSSMRSMSLGRVAFEGHLTETRQTIPSGRKMRSHDSVISPISEYFPESAIGPKFSRLLVNLQLELTKDHCIMLATYFTFPESKIDLIKNDGGTPALTLLSVMKQLGIINMYDVTNLQKALDYVKLTGINKTFVNPYQRRIDPILYEQNKVTQPDY